MSFARHPSKINHMAHLLKFYYHTYRDHLTRTQNIQRRNREQITSIISTAISHSNAIQLSKVYIDDIVQPFTADTLEPLELVLQQINNWRNLKILRARATHARNRMFHPDL